MDNALLTCILEVLGSNFGQDTGYPDRFFGGFLQPLHRKARTVPPLEHYCFHINDESPCRLMLCSLRYCQHHKIKHTQDTDYANVRKNKIVAVGSIFFFFAVLMFSSEDELSKELQGATAVAESASLSQHKPYEID